jgi:hypothetical protein
MMVSSDRAVTGSVFVSCLLRIVAYAPAMASRASCAGAKRNEMY